MEPNSVTSKQPDWVAVKKYEIAPTHFDKISNIANYLLLGVVICGVLVDGSGLFLYASGIAIVLAARKIVSIAIGYRVYHATSRDKKHLEKMASIQIEELGKLGFLAEKVSFFISGIEYGALRISHKDTMNNGKWVIHAGGNGMAIEDFAALYAQEDFKKRQCNTLLINGPSVGTSNGLPTPYNMGAGFELGIRYLEETVKATHIIMEGLSLGGAMMGNAVLMHDFKKTIRYLSISDRTFNYLSTIAAALVGKWVLPFFYLSGTELDGVNAAKKLSEHKITQIVIQHTQNNGAASDGLITDHASLAYELHKDPKMTHKIFLESNWIEHSGDLPQNIQNQLNEHISQFLKK